MALSTPLTAPDLAARYRAEGYWRDQTLYDRFATAAAAHPGKAAVIDGDGRFTYAEISDLVDRIATRLLALGLPPGALVAVQSKNAAELPIIHLAVHRIGGLYMPLHDSWRDVEIEHLLGQAKVWAVIAPGVYRDFDHGAMFADLKSRLPELQHIFSFDSDGSGGHRAFAELLEPVSIDRAALDDRRPDADAPATIMLSGGTTSLSKISRFSSNNLLNMLDCYAEAAGYGPDEISAAIAPAGTGATGYVYPILSPLLFGATSVILRRWKDPEEAVALIVDSRATHATGIPTQLTLMIPALEKRDPSDFADFRVFTDAGAPLPFGTAERIEALMGCKIQTLYGATDGGTPTMTAVGDAKDKRLSTVGRVAAGCECQLWDPDGNTLPSGQQGEVVWRGPDKSWGYLNDDDATAKAFTADGFYRSGDVGEFDADGYLRITGRIKDMILRGGRNVSPRTSEELLIKHPAVLEVAVAAMPDPVLGERACAFVMLRDGQSLDFDEMIAFLTERKIAIWQLPERLEIVADLPRGVGGKITKAQLTALVAGKLKAEGKLGTHA